MAARRADTDSLQNAFHVRLTRYVNGSHLAPGDLPLSLLSMRLSRARHEAGVREDFARLRDRLGAESDGAVRSLRITAYEGDDPRVRALERALAGDRGIRAILLHGSLASGDALPYSDFDALVVLRDALLSEPGSLAATVVRLSRARRWMFAFDPLQHHGWFVLTEADLGSYPDSYLPLAALERSRCLRAHEQELEVRPRPCRLEATEMLAALTRGVESQCAPDRRPRDLYQVKSFLSRFMLLPAVYLHVREGVGVYKGESFAMARADFSESAWRAMDRASAVRAAWDYPISGARRFVLTRSLVARSALVRRLAPPIPQALAAQLGGNFYEDAATLTRSFRDTASRLPGGERLAG